MANFSTKFFATALDAFEESADEGVLTRTRRTDREQAFWPVMDPAPPVPISLEDIRKRSFVEQIYLVSPGCPLQYMLKKD